VSEVAPISMVKGPAAACSVGIVVGPVQKLDAKHLFIQEYKIQQSEVASEVARFKVAIKQAGLALEQEIQDLTDHHFAEDLLPILHAHQLMLNDHELVGKTCVLIEEKLINAEWALKKRLQRLTKTFEHIKDAYLRSRKEDIEHIGQRILSFLIGDEQPLQRSESIMVAMDFSPSEIVAMWRAGVSGFVAVQGGKDSHTMIVARGLGLPGITGVQGLFEQIEDGDELILDAENGRWVLHPDEVELAHYVELQKQLENEERQLQFYVHQNGLAKPLMPIMANLEFFEEVEVANKYGVDGVGLFRTEFLFMQNKKLPSEEQQFEYYAQVVKGLRGKPVTFRLLDLGADKLAQAESMTELYDGENPSLGLRGVRLLLHKPDLLQKQLRAILRTSEFAEISVLVPMVSSVEEMLAVRYHLDKVKEDLGINREIKLGCMIEVPAAVFIANELARVSDFFSIGSNDLAQYCLAVDRSDEHVSYLYDSSHPAVLKLIGMAVEAAKLHAIPIAICGELASNPDWTETFLNLNVSYLSMSARKVLSIRKKLHHLQAL